MGFNMNSGYSGWSMSNRAVAAYEDGEMPKSKWTKGAMIRALFDYLDEFDIPYTEELVEEIGGMRKAQIFQRFFEWRGWHHTSKFCNETDFYGIDEDAWTFFVEGMNE